jgi:phage gpG-like protein
MAKVIDKDMGWERIKLNFKQLEGRSVKVGVMGGEENDGVAVVDYAVYNEFGTSRIPPRPFMATTAENNREYIQQFTGHLVGRIIDGAISVNVALKNLGEAYQAKIQMTIRNAKQWAEPNAPATIKAKGSSSPLIDTGRLVQSIRYEVK